MRGGLPYEMALIVDFFGACGQAILKYFYDILSSLFMVMHKIHKMQLPLILNHILFYYYFYTFLHVSKI